MVKKSINNKIVMKIAKKYAKEICKNYSIEAIILFGSYAKGTEHQDSDIDIAIITNDFNNNIFNGEIELKKLRWNIDLRIEPHIIKIDDYKNISTPFIEEIINTGIKLA